MADINGFPDRRERLFGREEDVRFLVGRSQQPGLTAVIGRPRLGKTWLLEETARRLSEETDCLVGYHESRGQSSDMLLRATGDLYARWLFHARMWQQARSLYERHKDKLITSIGQAVGRVLTGLFSVTNPPLQKVTELVSESFDGLALANRDLTTGGLMLRPLDYDQALELVRVLASVTEKRLVLILDAWEQSPDVSFERRTLELFLDRLADWPALHVHLGIRRPHRNERDQRDPAYNAARGLDAHPEAWLHELAPMQLDGLEEQDRLVQFLHDEVPATGELARDRTLGLVGGFPGVVEQWVKTNARERIVDEKQLRSLADDAQRNRYRDFDQLLPALSGDERKLAIRLAMLPRMDERNWAALKEVVLDGCPESLCEELCVHSVLEAINPPYYGHDTRHQAARRWFLERAEFRPLTARQTLQMIRDLADRFERIDERNRPFAESLRSLRGLGVALGLGDEALALCDAAAALFKDSKREIDWTAFDRWWARLADGNSRGIALLCQALVNRGVTKGQLGDSQRKMADYTAVIEMPDAPADQKAKALFNRGVTKGQLGDSQGAVADYTAVVEMPDAPEEARELAQRALDVFRGKDNRSE